MLRLCAVFHPSARLSEWSIQALCIVCRDGNCQYTIRLSTYSLNPVLYDLSYNISDLFVVISPVLAKFDQIAMICMHVDLLFVPSDTGRVFFDDLANLRISDVFDECVYSEVLQNILEIVLQSFENLKTSLQGIEHLIRVILLYVPCQFGSSGCPFYLVCSSLGCSCEQHPFCGRLY